MAKQIIIVGGLQEEANRACVLETLRERSQGEEVTWEWIYADEADHYDPPRNHFRRMLETVRQTMRLRKDADKPSDEIVVVKLYCLHQRAQSQLYGVYPDPVLVPADITCAEAMIEWVFSAEASLLPRQEWWATRTEAAIAAILAKLIRNKSWNKNKQGHNWTKEEDLLGQAPVLRRDCQEVAVEARTMLARLEGPLLLCKGSSQGRTPKEWSIRLEYLPVVKQAMLQSSLAPLAGVAGLSQIAVAGASDIRPYRLDEEVVTERVRQTCRDVR